MLRAVEGHLGSNQVSRVLYGSIIGLALVVALEDHHPRPGVMVATLAWHRRRRRARRVLQ